jgi:hypothetical protein
MTEDSIQPLSVKRELINVLLLTTACEALLIAFYLPSHLKYSSHLAKEKSWRLHMPLSCFRQ